MDFGLIALRFYKLAMEASSKDHLFEGMVASCAAMVMALLGQLKAAVESEKHAYVMYCNILGSDNQITRVSDPYLQVNIESNCILIITAYVSHQN
jgi:hypothetical protein